MNKDLINHTVYLHRNKINNKVYVGQTSLNPIDRWSNGFGYRQQPYFWKAIQRYGWDNFEHIILATNLSQEDANKMETYWIKFFNSNNEQFGYNKTSGGKGSSNLSARSLEKKRESLKKYWESEVGRNQARKHSLEVSGINNPMYGKHHTQESKDKISLGHKGSRNPNFGKSLSDEHKQKIGESNKGKHNNSGSNNPNSKRVYCIETGIVYDTIKEASLAIGVCYKTMLRAIKDPDKIVKGCHWKILPKEDVL